MTEERNILYYFVIGCSLRFAYFGFFVIARNSSCGKVMFIMSIGGGGGGGGNGRGEYPRYMSIVMYPPTPGILTPWIYPTLPPLIYSLPRWDTPQPPWVTQPLPLWDTPLLGYSHPWSYPPLLLTPSGSH